MSQHQAVLNYSALMEVKEEVFMNLRNEPAPISLSQSSPEGRKTYETKCPATDEVLAATIQGTEEDVDVAVSAAQTAHASWSQLPGHVRARHLYAVARHVQKHQRLIRSVLG